MKNKRNVNAKWFVLKVLWLGAGALTTRRLADFSNHPWIQPSRDLERAHLATEGCMKVLWK